MKVGIGVPTVGRRTISDGYLGHATRPTRLHVQFDADRLGPGWARNQCIGHLYDAGCDLIVLMDDDCYPVADGWQDYLLDGMAARGLHVVNMDDPRTGLPVGCFLALTRHAVDTLGCFSAAFRGYGFEDVHYLHRIVRSGVNGTAGNATLERLHEFVLSEDVMKPASATEYANMTRAEKDEAIARNLPIFEREMADPRNYRNREGL